MTPLYPQNLRNTWGYFSSSGVYLFSADYYTGIMQKQQERVGWNEVEGWIRQRESNWFGWLRKWREIPNSVKGWVSEINQSYDRKGNTDRGGKTMLSLLFAICMIWVFGKLFFFGIRACWGISKFLITVVLFPLILIGMVVGGLLYIAFPILIVVGIVMLVCKN